MKEILIRFLIGGAVVSLFAALGALFKPKSFAGLFGAAPAVAMATLSLTVVRKGADYASTESRSMMAGAIAFFVYASVVSWVLMRYKSNVLLTASAAMVIWLMLGLGLWRVWLK